MVSISVYTKKICPVSGQVAKQQGAVANEPMCSDPRHTSHAASQQRRASLSNQSKIFFRTPRSAPHFTHNLVSNQAPCGCNGKDAAIKRPKTRAMAPPQRVEERPRLSRELAWCGLGVLHGEWREPPENWDGGVRNEQRKDSTHDVGFQFPAIYTNTLQYLLHFHNKT